MNLPSLLDVAIGLVLMFFLLSTLGSVLVELLAALRKWRNRLLRDSVAALVEAPLVLSFWGHPLLRPLFEEQPLADCDDQEGLWSRVKCASRKTGAYILPKSAAPAYLDSSLFATVVLDLASGQGRAGRIPPTAAAWEHTIRTHLPSSPGANNDLQDRLLALLRQVPPEATEFTTAFKAEIVRWFDEAMKRTSGEYRRLVQRALLFVGLGLALALNCDAIRIAYVLYQNPSLREQVAQQAATLVRETPPTTAPAGDTTVAALRADLQGNVRQLRDLTKVGFPIGWMPETEDNFIYLKNSDTGGEPGLTSYLAKIGGLLASALAVCLGAPFWFDLLGRLVKLRSAAGAEAEKPKSPTEGSTPAPASANAANAGPLNALHGAAAARPLPPLLDALVDPRTEFSAARAYWLGMAADKAYLEPPAVEGWFAEQGLALAAPPLRDPKTGTEAYLAVGAGVAVLAFRGTEPSVLRDWITDAKAAMQDGAALGLPGRLHRGFAEAFASIQTSLDEAVEHLAQQGVMLHVTGHSLGGALATLAAAYLARRHEFPVHSVHTFGSPRVGDSAFVGYFDTEFAGRAYRIVNNEDLVTRVPPRRLPLPGHAEPVRYEHVGAMVYIDDRGQLQRDIGYWCRFLNFATNALEDFKKAAATTVRDHSMKLYCGFLEKSARSPR